MWEFPYCFHFISSLLFQLHCLSNIPFTFFACKNFYSVTSTMDPPTTLYTQHCVSLYSLATDPAWVNFTFRQAIMWDATADDYLGIPDTNGSCRFVVGSPTDTVGSQNFQPFSTRQTPHLGDWWGELTTPTTSAFPRSTFKSLLSKALFHLRDYPESLDCLTHQE